MVDINTLIVKLIGDAPVPITAMMLIIYRKYMLPDGIISIRLPKAFSVIIEC